MHKLDSAMAAFSTLSMDQINALIAMLGLAVAGLAVYLALVIVRGSKR
jgi:hypothetical protein